MFPLFETIPIRAGTPFNLRYHEERVARSCQHLFGRLPGFSLAEVIRGVHLRGDGLFRLRVNYNGSDFATELMLYEPKKISALRLVYDNSISYAYKFSDRAALQELYARRGAADDVVIVKNGLITDTSYANLAFKQRDGQWVTPHDPLLRGTMRQELSDRGGLIARDIAVEDLPSFESFKLINAMLRFDFPELPVSAIVE